MVDDLLKNIHKTEIPKDWVGSRGFLKGKYREMKIWELGFQADKRQYRILGVFGKKRKQATLLVGCNHKQRVYTPPDALDLAFERSKKLLRGEARQHERKIKENI